MANENYYYNDQSTNMYQPDLTPIYYSYHQTVPDLSQNNIIYNTIPQYDIIDIDNNNNNVMEDLNESNQMTTYYKVFIGLAIIFIFAAVVYLAVSHL